MPTSYIRGKHHGKFAGRPPTGTISSTPSSVTQDAAGTVSTSGGGVVKAFPTAEGYGAASLGIRGTGTAKVYIVTSLEDDPAATAAAAAFDGTARWAMEKAGGPRLVVFQLTQNAYNHTAAPNLSDGTTAKQPGCIYVQNTITIKNPYCYIAGQTASGDGILFRNDPSIDRGVGQTYRWGTIGTTFQVNTHDVTMRFLKVRPGRQPGCEDASIPYNVGLPKTNCAPPNVGTHGSKDGLRAISVTGSSAIKDVIIDHCSGSWTNDTNMMMGGGGHDVTFQYCIMAEPGRNFGHTDIGCCGLDEQHQRIFNAYCAGAFENNLTMSHNLLAHFSYRAPEIQYPKVEVINQTMYEYEVGGDGGSNGAMLMNVSGANIQAGNLVRIIGNYWKAGPATQAGTTAAPLEFGHGAVGGVGSPHPVTTMNAYITGNVGPHRPLVSGATDTRSSTDFDIINDKTGWLSPGYQNTDDTAGFTKPTYPVTIEDALTAHNKIISLTTPKVGAYLPTRDYIDTRIITRVRNGTGVPANPRTGGGAGTIYVHQMDYADTNTNTDGYPKLVWSNTLCNGISMADTDLDGIPDAWWGIVGGRAQALDSGVTQANHVSRGDTATAESDGPGSYLWIEQYVNDLVGE